MSSPVPNNLLCKWSTQANGQCSEEGDFIISFTFAPCGCQDEIGNSHQYCIRHTVRAFHLMMGKVTCAHCGREYRGIQRLLSVTRL